MGVLKHFAGVVCGLIIAVHNSNDADLQLSTPKCQKRVKGIAAGVTSPRKICVLYIHLYSSERLIAINANISVRAKAMNFKFGTHASMDNPDMTRAKIFKNKTWLWSRDPVNFWALNATSSKMAKDTNFKFGTRAPKESLEITREKIFEKGAWLGSRDPVIFGAINANSSKMAKDT